MLSIILPLVQFFFVVVTCEIEVSNLNQMFCKTQSGKLSMNSTPTVHICIHLCINLQQFGLKNVFEFAYILNLVSS